MATNKKNKIVSHDDLKEFIIASHNKLIRRFIELERLVQEVESSINQVQFDLEEIKSRE